LIKLFWSKAEMPLRYQVKHIEKSSLSEAKS